MNVTAHDAPRHAHGQWFWFGRHFLAMTAAMVLGMAVYGIGLGVVLGLAGSSVEDARIAQPVLFALGMATSMSVPMVALMRRMGHDWQASGEMTAAMFVPVFVLMGCYWLDRVSAESVCPIACAAMIPATLVAMLYRREAYTCSRSARGSAATTSS